MSKQRDKTMSKAYSVLKVKSFEESGDERTITGIASTPSMDRDNDVIEAKGAKFALPIPLLWQHNHNQPIGEVTHAEVTDKGVEFTATIAKIDEDGALKSRIDEAWQSIKSGLVKCVSVGFRALDYEYLKDAYGLHIKSWEWYELSVVTVPANPDAVITSAKQIKKAFAEADIAQTPQEQPVEAAEAVETSEEAEAEETDETDPKTAETKPAAVDNPSHVALIDPAAGAIPLIDGV